MLMHGTIEMSGQTPMDAADRFIKLAADDTKINLASNILFSCACPCPFEREPNPSSKHQSTKPLFCFLASDSRLSTRPCNCPTLPRRRLPSRLHPWLVSAISCCNVPRSRRQQTAAGGQRRVSTRDSDSLAILHIFLLCCSISYIITFWFLRCSVLVWNC